ncbi:MAG: multidrug ABC transporter permease [Balneola sp.]|jgi:ABC-2 type transport system permease protein|nr:multidrug ABC transporter permease [Balneola sp.]MBE80166.1 multidrug ABC transporter permease [Balneola sp.]|tara:strand:+ start:18831 stop:19940 length:1110 start_codon:yes stop_codon:yes gene_type:complete
MNSFSGFVTKEFKQIYRDKRTLAVLFGMPIIMLVLFGFAIRNEVTNAQIGILDLSKDEVTRTLTQKLEASSSFQIQAYLESYEEVEGLFKQGNIKEIVVFEADFKEKLIGNNKADIQIITDATDPNLANLVQSYTSNIIRDYVQELNETSGVQQAGLNPKVRMMYNPELRSVNLFVPGLIAVILMLISALMTSISITREKELGNMEILLVSPLKPYHIIIGKVLPYLVLSVVNVVTILVLASFVFQVPFQGSYFLFFMEAILFILTALALGVFISSAANNQQTAMMVSLAGLLLPTVLLSGFIFPVDSMPVPLQIVSHAIPAKWFLIIVRSIMLKGSEFMLIWKETAILVGITLFFIALSLKKFKVRLQ